MRLASSRRKILRAGIINGVFIGFFFLCLEWLLWGERESARERLSHIEHFPKKFSERRGKLVHSSALSRRNANSCRLRRTIGINSQARAG